MKIIVITLILLLTGIGYFVYQKSNPPTPGQVESGKITEQQAVKQVKSQPEVQDYLKRVSNGIVEVDNEEVGRYNVHAYEIKDGHTATFNWYQVDKDTGEVKKEF